MEKETINFTPKDGVLYKVNRDLGDFRKGAFITFMGISDEEIIAMRQPYYCEVNSYGEKILCQPLDMLHIALLLEAKIISVVELEDTIMSYELCKKLKEAGFPQKISEHDEKSGSLAYTKEKEVILFDDEFWRDGTPEYYIPTLSELIKACGKDFFTLKRFVATGSDKLIWAAIFIKNTDEHIFGETPEEAVSNLWLNSNK